MQGSHTRKRLPPASVRWSAWLGPRLQSAAGRRKNPRPTGGGMTGAAAGQGRTKGRTGREEGHADERTRTGVTTKNGNTLAIEEPNARDSGPNGPKLSDGGKKSKELGADATPPFAGARC